MRLGSLGAQKHFKNLSRVFRDSLKYRVNIYRYSHKTKTIMTIKSGTGFSSKGSMRAIIAAVELGHLGFEGLRFGDGTFAIAIPQLVALNLIAPDTSLKELELSLGMDFQSLPKVETVIYPEAVDCLSLSDFGLVIRALDKRGVEAAVGIVDAMFGLATVQLFSDAFGDKFDGEERQAWLDDRKDLLPGRHYLFQNANSRNSQSEKKVKPVDKVKLRANIENFAVKLIDNKGYEPLTAVKVAVDLMT